MSVEATIDHFLSKFTPAMHDDLRAARAHMRGLFPNGFELVFDNYNALVFGYSASGRTPEAFISIAGYPRWVTLFFLQGSALPDPGRRLQGSGSTVRSVRLAAPATLDEAEIQALIAEAIRPHRAALALAGPLSTTIKAVAPTQRPRQPARVTRR